MHSNLSFALALAFFSAGMFVSTNTAAQIAKEDSTRKARADSTKKAIDEAALEAELARELGAVSGETETPESPPDLQGAQISGSTSRSAATLNPRISVIGTFFGVGTSNEVLAKPYNLGLTEAEFSFQAYVDPYAKADFFVGFASELGDPFAQGEAQEDAGGAFSPELEEGYLTTLALPYSLQIKAGKFLNTFGKINSIHSHAHNFVDFPRMYVNYLGEEGLVESGISINWLVPNPFDLYEELTLEITNPGITGPSFNGQGKDLLYLLHWKNFFDLNDDTSLELGFTGMHGPNDAENHKSQIAAFDLTVKWKPLRLNRYKSFEWITEGLLSWRDFGPGKLRSQAMYSFARYQIGRRWFLGGRYDYSEFPENNKLNEQAFSFILSHVATEFQKFELQYQRGLPAVGKDFHRLMLRAVFVIGAHGAHKY